MGSQGTRGKLFSPVAEEDKVSLAETGAQGSSPSREDQGAQAGSVLIKGDFRDTCTSADRAPLRPLFSGGKVRVFGHFVPVQILLLAFTEAVAFTFAWLFGSSYSADAGMAPVLSSFSPSGLMAPLLLVMSLGAVGLYSAHQRAEFNGVLSRAVVAFTVALLGLQLLSSVFPILQHSPQALLIAGSLSALSLGGIRYLFYRHCDGSLLVRRVLVVGTGKRARSIERLRRKSDRRGFRLMGFVNASGDAGSIHVSPDRIVSSGQRFCRFALENHIDEIVVALDDRRQGAIPTDELLNCRMSGIDVTDLLDFFERETAKIRLDLLRPSWLIHSDGFRRHVLRDFAKRAFDLSLAAVLFVLTLPLLALTAAAVYLDSGGKGSVFYRQQRVGQNGKPFDLIKFRSMRMDAEKDGKARWASQNDPRVTRVGSFIRKYRLDELPQLWNVLRNDMSIVGPRPERPQFVDQLSRLSPLYKERHRVKPGIAGWAQLRYPYGASEQDSIEKLQYDLYYVKNHRLLFDLYILVQTVEVVLYSKGAR